MKKIIKSSNNVFIVVSFIFIIVGLVLLIDKYSKKIQIEKEHIIVNSTVISTINDENNSEYDAEIQKLKNKFKNEDIIGILYVSDIITEPIVQGSDNNYYLRHNLSKELMPGGAIFLDFKTSIGDKQLNVYGHNSTRYSLPFKNLENYLNNEFTKKNNYIKFKTESKTYKYEIFSVYIDAKSEKDEHFKFNFNNNSEWLTHFNKIKSSSFYKNDLEISENDNIIVLQTCLFKENRNKLLIIIGKQIN